MLIADGGYLSWTYGCDPRFQQNWSGIMYINHLIAMDGSPLRRNEVYGEYKSARVERRAEDPAKEEKYQAVKRFHEIMWKEPFLRLWSYPGLEADDLVALLAWRHGAIDLLGVDKDLLQLGTTINSMQRVDGRTVTMEDWAKKLPKALYDVPITPDFVLFYLALMGDKSDSVQRLIPNYQLNEFRMLCHEKYRWTRAYWEYGAAFLNNLYVVALPYPEIFGLSPLDLLDAVQQKEYRPSTYMWGRLELFNEELFKQLLITIESWSQPNPRLQLAYEGNF